MSETYTKLKELLDKQKSLSQEDIDKMVKEHGEMTHDEMVHLESDRLEAAKETAKTASDIVTMDQYLEACKVLDTAAEGSEEYKKAEAIVNKYEAGV